MWYYLILINIVAFIQMGLDKSYAKNKKRRISEKSLFTMAIIGGSLGSILGMQVYRHKTKHNSFVYGMPLIFIAQMILYLYK